MKIDDSVDWDIDRTVGAGVVRGNIGRVDYHVGAEVGSSDGEEV